MNTTSQFECTACGKCCIHNGLIPPLLYHYEDSDDENAPEWLIHLVDRLRTLFSAEAEDYPCVFLTDDMRCAIYEHRPAVCREFQCESQDAHRDCVELQIDSQDVDQ